MKLFYWRFGGWNELWPSLFHSFWSQQEFWMTTVIYLLQCTKTDTDFLKTIKTEVELWILDYTLKEVYGQWTIPGFGIARKPEHYLKVISVQAFYQQKYWNSLYLLNPSSQAWFDSRSIFMWTLAGFNSEVSFS